MTSEMMVLETRMLSPEEEIEMVRRAADGDTAATVKVCHSVSGWVSALARAHCRRTNIDFYDAYQEAMIGVLKAIKHFDPAFGVRFITYSRYWIREALNSYSIRSRVVNGGNSQARKIRAKFANATARNFARYGESRQEEVLKDIGVKESRLREVMFSFTPIPIDDVDEEFISKDCPETTTQEKIRSDTLRACLEQLGERERTILIREVMGDDTGVSIAEEWGISRQRIEQLKKRGIAKMKELLGEVRDEIEF